MSAPEPIPEPVRQHSPLPWHVEGHCSRPRDDRPKGHRIVSARGDGFEFHIAAVGTHPGINSEQAAANAAFIIEAVNSHATLKAQVEQLESNAREQAKLLADTGRRVEEMGAVARAAMNLEYYVNNPSAWESFDDEMSERIRPVVDAARAALSSGEAGK